jgi:hypothetical protein
MRPTRYRLRLSVWLIRRIIACLDYIDRRHHAWYLARQDRYDHPSYVGLIVRQKCQ